MLKKLKKLKELHAKTTEGPWFKVMVFKPDIFEIYTTEKQICQAIYKNDVEFITEAHKMLPRLIEALEKCIEQRNFYVQEFFRLNFSREAETTDLLNQKLEQILEGKK